MGAYYGLRRSEILGLKWNAIDWERKTISIQHTVVRVTSVMAENATKTQAGGQSAEPFWYSTKLSGADQAGAGCKQEFFGNTYANQDGYIFTWEDGRQYDPNYVSRMFTRAMTDYGRPEITLHNLRHTCCSMLINRGWDLKKLQYWTGHSDASTTLNIYSHFNRKRLNESENDLNGISAAASDLF